MRTLLSLFLACFAALAFGQQPAQSLQVAIVSAATAQGVGTAYSMGRSRVSASNTQIIANTPFRTFHASGTVSNSTGAATVKVQVSADGTTWIDACTVTLTLSTTAAGDGCAMSASWPLVRGNVTAISGTGATVSLYMGL